MKKLIYSQEDLDLILVLELEEKDKVINDLLSRIATLEYEIERLEKENNLLKQIIGNDKKYSYGIRMGSDK